MSMLVYVLGALCYFLILIGYTREDAASDSRQDAFTLPLVLEEPKEAPVGGPKFVTSEWGDCSVTCGRGLRRRYVRCQVYLVFIEDIADLSDNECMDSRPANTEPCDAGPCFEDFEWQTAGMGPCSKSCLGGIQETKLLCMHKRNKAIVDDIMCSGAAAPPIERRVCNDIACPQRWRTGEFGACSVTCGGGTKSRDVQCIQEHGRGESNLFDLPDFMCPRPTPSREVACNTDECPASWAVGIWSECSVTCGRGVYVRNVFCHRYSISGDFRNVSDNECVMKDKPISEKNCTSDTCPVLKIVQNKLKFFQLNKLNRVKLTVGMEAALLPGTSVIVRCPSRGVNRRLIRWFKNGRPLRKSKRIKVSRKGTLRIRTSRPDKDAGYYTCTAKNLAANITLSFSNVFDLIPATEQRKKYLSGINLTGEYSNSTVKQKDPFDRKKKLLHVVVGEWTLCGVSCGGSFQYRNVTCEIITNDYFEIFPNKHCSRMGIKKLAKMKPCNEAPCVEWKLGSWSECLFGSCARNGYAVQFRNISCVMENTDDIVNKEYCDALPQQPTQYQECLNFNCSTDWNVSEWTECRGKCEETGFQTRMLTCVWKDSLSPAGKNCEMIPRPETYRECTVAACPKYCRDKSRRCEIARLMKLCKYSRYKKECCKTCNEES